MEDSIKLKEKVNSTNAINKRVSSKQKNFNDVVYKRVGTVKKPTKTFHQNLSYDFLQYVRIVFKWACSNYEINRPNLELILGLYPLGIFKRIDFEVFCRTIDMNPKRLMKKLVDDGWIKVWRPNTRGQAALFCLTTKAKVMCGKMHKICLGESKITEYKYGNSLMTSEKVVDKYYLEVIKRMNSRDTKDAKDVVDDDK